MKSGAKASIVLINSSKPDNKSFGTGFVFHQNERATYLLTCAHVIDNVDADHVQVDGVKAELISSGKDYKLDLAVLRVDKNLGKPNLLLRRCEGNETNFTTIGYGAFTEQTAQEKIYGSLGKQIEITASIGPIKVWHLNIKDDDLLKPGFSGSPIIDEISGDVLGIASHLQGEGKKGFAIAIENLQKLKEVWEDIPCNLIKPALGEVNIHMAVIVMTQKEANSLDTGEVFEDGQGSKEYKQLTELKHALQIENLASYYGMNRSDWKPLTAHQMPIEDTIQNVIIKLNKDRLKSIGKKTIGVKDVSDEFFSEDSQTIINILAEQGGILIVDAISMYHPKLGEEVINSQLMANPKVAMIVISPLASETLKIYKILEDQIYNRWFKTPYNFHDQLKRFYEFNISDTHNLRRCLYSILPQLTPEEKYPPPEIVNIVEEQGLSFIGKSGGGIREKITGKRY